MFRFDPDRPDLTPYGFKCVRWTPTAMPRSDRHNEIELNLIESGKLVYLLGGRKVQVPAGRLTAFWAVVPHQILEFEGLESYYVLTIPLPWFLQWRLPERFTQAILGSETIMEPDVGMLDGDRKLFEIWQRDLASGSDERVQISLLEIHARLRRLAWSLAPDVAATAASAPSDPTNLSRAEQIASYIAQNYTKQLTADMIGEEVGLHPNYAMALFQKTFGTTLIKYVTQHRLSHAQRLLVTVDDSILNIAIGSGFGSLSRFNEAFRQAFGCTPREYRKLNKLEPARQTRTDE